MVGDDQLHSHKLNFAFSSLQTLSIFLETHHTDLPAANGKASQPQLSPVANYYDYYQGNKYHLHIFQLNHEAVTSLLLW